MIRLEDGSEKRVGSQTECGLLDFARSQGADYGHLREQAEELLFIPFNSRRKRMTSAFPSPESEGVARVYVKGASEIILNMCTKRLVEGGEEREMDVAERQHIGHSVIEDYAYKAYRTLTLAYKDYPIEDLKAGLPFAEEEQRQVLESNLTLVAVVGIQDPLRVGVVEAIAKCNNANINVRMVTGDNLLTAKAIS